jgi:hypothetical protein
MNQDPPFSGTGGRAQSVHIVFLTLTMKEQNLLESASPCAGYPSKMDGWMIGNGEVESLLKRQGSKPRVISIAQA